MNLKYIGYFEKNIEAIHRLKLKLCTYPGPRPNSPTTYQDLNGTLMDNTSVKQSKLKLFCFSSDFVLQLHQVSSKSDENQKSFINSPFFYSEFQSVSRIVKIVHSACMHHLSTADNYVSTMSSADAAEL